LPVLEGAFVAAKFNQISIMGVGLLGGAVGLAARKAGIAGRVVGYCRRSEAARAAVEAGAVDECLTDLAKAAAGSDLVVLCTGPETVAEIAAGIVEDLPDGAIVTDVASVKSRVVAGCVEALGKKARFVGSHPLAGSEKRGVENAADFALDGAVCVVTPNRSTDSGALEAVKGFWTELGLEVVELSPEEHDARLARTSHLPHTAAAALCALIKPGDERFCAAGFRDATRVAAGDPGMWTEIAFSNREALAAELYKLAKRLQGAADLLTAADRDALREFLESGANRRSELMGRE
jgi:prephenate dehydrogenase